MKKILLVGPFPKPITGLSLANEVLYKGLIKQNDVDIINMSYSKFEEVVGGFNIYKMFYFLKLNLYFFKSYKYDSIYITIGQSFFGVMKYALLILTGRLFNKNIVIHLHGNQLKGMYDNLTFIKKIIIKRILSMANYGIVLSNSLKKNLTFCLKEENVFIINNFIEDDLFISDIEYNLKNYNDLRIVYIGNLMTEKGIFYLLDALNMLQEKNIIFKARFAGNIDGDIQEKVMSYFERNKDLEYLGVVRNKDKKDLLLWANTFVFPSYLIEGLPLSILEAIVTRNTIITTKHQSLNDILDEENLFFVNKNSDEEIVNALLKQAIEIDEQKILNNYNSIKHFTESKFVSEVEKILHLK
ncbi:hypothetical protein LPB03_08435 [Polaribacter vadi]|uniref:Glycosyl transferase family 1 domain-containing protein n=1 Tax=Polaribacter vadi TaxID=1774273 RepID=A0A1B8U2Y3_9FLAO|nr:glycosyltransferase family 4 protein [Polaribacter vadi]AOW17491.1 hypothetical protein LPB03_08435 [Polaribacter vadi]OBY66182.1 hypothetical protein LPB3_01820 [Polaribacter vadi]